MQIKSSFLLVSALLGNLALSQSNYGSSEEHTTPTPSSSHYSSKSTTHYTTTTTSYPDTTTTYKSKSTTVYYNNSTTTSSYTSDHYSSSYYTSEEPYSSGSETYHSADFTKATTTVKATRTRETSVPTQSNGAVGGRSSSSEFGAVVFGLALAVAGMAV